MNDLEIPIRNYINEKVRAPFKAYYKWYEETKKKIVSLKNSINKIDEVMRKGANKNMYQETYLFEVTTTVENLHVIGNDKFGNDARDKVNGYLKERYFGGQLPTILDVVLLSTSENMRDKIRLIK
jgi:hypothetical protein